MPPTEARPLPFPLPTGCAAGEGEWEGAVIISKGGGAPHRPVSRTPSPTSTPFSPNQPWFTSSAQR